VEAVRPGRLDNVHPRGPRGTGGFAMKLLAALVTVTVLAAIVAVNRDDIMRYVKMRQM
jgi:uncharacterized protein DUF6893